MAETFLTPAFGEEIENGAEYIPVELIPKQKAPPASDDPSMKAYICTYPPLGQVTQIDKSTTVFTALLEVDENRASDPWQLSLWHSEGGQWQEVPMDPLRSVEAHPSALQDSKTSSGPALTRLCFTTPLAIHLPTNFTIKVRGGADKSWKWVKDHQGAADGTVMLKSVTIQDTISSELGDYVQGLNPVLKSKKYRSQSPRTTLWSVETPIEAADGEKSRVQNIKFGLPWGQGKFSRWFALVRIWTPWLAPRQGKTEFRLDKEAVMCSFLSLTGKHLVLLGISGVDDVMTMFTSDSEGTVILRVRNDSVNTETSRVLVAHGDDFESANAAVMYHARGIVAACETVTGEQQREFEALKERDESTKLWAENWYDGLTYCTWNALGQRLTEEKVLKAVTTLAENDINVTNFIIDDNWQSIDYRGDGQFQHGWVEFEAERNAFPNGLKGMVTKIREKHPSIQHIAVWHALLGYWGGLAPDGKLAKTYQTVEVVREDAKRRNLPLGGKLVAVAKEDVPKFYDDFYRFLSSCGVDAVKTDAQFMLDTFKFAIDRRELINTYLDAWTVSTLRHFSVKAISCMSQTPHILFHSQMPQNRPPILVRNSDDFFPEIPSSHPWHIWVNAHNALFTQHLNLIPDWDMFQTVHDYSGFHAAARCVSGGPIYITDVPGQHDLDLINQMTGPTPRGKTVIFRPSVVGKSLDPYNGYNDDKLLLVGTYHGGAVTGTGMIGFFNVSQRPLSELIPLSKFPGVVEAQYYIIRAHSSGLVTKPMQMVDKNALIYISLGVRGYDILSSYPLRGFVDEKKNETTWIANLGLLGKMAGAAAIVENRITKLENGRISIDTDIKALGTLGLYISTLPQIAFKDSLMITIQGKVLPVHTISVSKVSEFVLEIDVEKAWTEMELESGWSNEVEVKIYINAARYAPISELKVIWQSNHFSIPPFLHPPLATQLNHGSTTSLPLYPQPTHPHIHKTTLIFLHGTSQTGSELASILLSFPIPPPVRSLSTSSNSDPLTQNQAETKTLAELLPNTRFVFPTGSPKKTTVFAGLETNSWFNIHTFVDRTLGETEQIPGLAESINYLSSLINDEVEELVKAGVRREEAGDRIVVGGFSSGAALAVLGFLSGEFERRERIGAVVALSGWLPFRAQIDKVIENHKEVGDRERKWAVRKYVRQLLYMNDGVQGGKMEEMREEKAEILICHGKKDVKVRYEWGVEMTGVLKRMGQKIECRSYEGLEHWVCGEEMLDVEGFVEGVWEGLE